ncbi:MAG TPA: hypothetical protein VEK11_09375 [Thermoanaerobaculia bacterium]|nr:hypothetical protein [Thermoanaerobaculia bacterium]
MRTPTVAVLSLLWIAAPTVFADELGCGTSVENDLRVRALHERVVKQRASRPRLEANATAKLPQLQDGAFYIEADEEIVPGYHPFDLAGQSFVFEPRGTSKFAVRRTALQYVEPSGAALKNFHESTDRTVVHNLGFTFPIFGRSVDRVYLTAFNAIHFDAPASEPGAAQFDDLEAAVHRGAVLSPLMITKGKPSRLAFPELFVDETADALVVTWRSTAGSAFGYDIQAQLRKDGTVVYTYKSMRQMSWGAPVLTAGFDPATAAREVLSENADFTNDTAAHVPAALRPMADIVSTTVSRIGGSDLFAVRIKVAAPLDQSKIPANTSLRYLVGIGEESILAEVSPTAKRVVPYNSPGWLVDGATMHVAGDTIELYAMQRFTPSSGGDLVSVMSYAYPTARSADSAAVQVPFGTPPQRVQSDLSAVPDGTELALPITEGFKLAVFNPFSTWEKVQSAHMVSDYDVDGVMMFQTFFTDLIFYAGAYATGGNAQVSGIAPTSPSTGPAVGRMPTLMHMNQLAYGWFATDQTASNVMLHELGHRWSYFFSIMENGTPQSSLNPVSAHPAAYVHTPAAFPVTSDPEQASVMGGAFFVAQPDGKYTARAVNVGYSWTDLYLMGLAAPEDVQPWFYLANTNPKLPDAYWPVDNTTVTGQKRNVAVQQIIDVHGARTPSVSLAQKQFRVAFVLVTENGREATAEEVAKLTAWRSILERNFATATGGRGRLVTTVVKPAKTRAVR